ncbi:hypothetical protein C8Q74DRAFT_1364547 [Fomes fomentarius]|nr:hypothetical protein C8Q74DRAFT_1364547 [Fomes fomentarius]
MALPDLPSKPLPPPVKDDKLPSLPPLDFDRDYDELSKPPPPPKIVHDFAPEPPHPKPAPIDVNASLAASDLSLGSAPLTPVSPNAGVLPQPPASPSADGKGKKANPLTDLIETEKVYVELLTGIIRKVAAAWSRSNLPPPELDTMFRCIESIYKANRSLLSKLKEIGTNPKGLGDLLMRWIDDLEGPYTNYSTKFCSGFDTWDLVQDNSRVRTILAMFSSTNPPPIPTSLPAHPSEPLIWTLDDLFVLPKGRIKYYKKLYSRLLKSTTPGRSDHRMLSGAIEKLDKLLATLDQRANVQVGGSNPKEEAPPPPFETEDEVVIDMRTRQSTLEPQPRAQASMSPSPSQRASDSTRASGSLSSSGRRSEDTAPTTDSRTSTSTLSMPVNDLERRLSTERTLDIFSMKPKQVRLQIAPPNLHYTRELRCSTSVVMTFTPRSTGVEIVQERGHVFLLTDLMLVCEKMTPKEMEVAGPGGSDMWLLYPPLAGKHLRVAPVDDVSLSVTILRKETLIMRLDSMASRDRLIADFRECIETASSLLPSSKNPPPPVPALPSAQGNMGNNVSRPPSVPWDHSHPPSVADVSSERFSDSMSPPSRAMSPASSQSRRSNDPSSPPSRVNSAGAALADAALSGDMGRMSLGPSQSPTGPVDQGYPPRSTSSAGGPRGPASGPGPQGGFGPGQIMPPRPGQFGPGQTMPPQAFGPGQVMPPGPGGPGGPMGRPPPSSFSPPNGPGALHRNPSFGYGPPPGEPGMPPSRQPSLTNGPPGPGGPGMHRQPSLNFAPGPGGSGFPPHAGPPQIGHSYQGMPPPGPGMGRGGFPPGPGMGMGPGPGRPAYGPGPAYPPPRPPSEPGMEGSRTIPSTRSLGGQQQQYPPNGGAPPPMPGYPGDFPPPQPGFLQRSGSSSSLPNLASGGLHAPQPRPLLPSAQMSMRSVSTAGSFSIEAPSPPGSPVEEIARQTGPVTSTVTAQMKCKVFLKQQHAQWKSLGSAKLRLYREDPTNIKQLVVEAEDKRKTPLISTIVLTDGVERVGKTGVAIELSDKGLRTGVVYMIQLRSDKAAAGLFDELLAGSDRANGR